jgi:hypothetical protein
MQNIIIENGEEMGTLSQAQIKYLRDAKLIYPCDSCNCYHINSNKMWIDIELALKGFPQD